MGFIAYTDQTGNSSKAAYSQVQTVPSHDAQQAEVTTQASLSPPPTTAVIFFRKNAPSQVAQ